MFSDVNGSRPRVVFGQAVSEHRNGRPCSDRWNKIEAQRQLNWNKIMQEEVPRMPGVGGMIQEQQYEHDAKLAETNRKRADACCRRC
jgi:hypothetical protein